MAKKRTHRSHKGSAYLYVVIVFVVVTLFATLMFSSMGHTIYQYQTYSMRMQAYYLTDEVADAIVVALQDTTGGGDTLLEKIKNCSYYDTKLVSEIGLNASDMEVSHKDPSTSSTQIGTSTIELYKEQHSDGVDNKDWVVAKIETTIPDPRPARSGANFVFRGSISILIENPTIRYKNIKIDPT